MSKYEQNPVSQVTWKWLQSDEPTTQATTPDGRKKVLITTPIALAIAYCVHRFLHHTTMAWVIVGIALFIAFSAYALPRVYAAIEGFFQRFAHWVGTAVTWLLMVPFFYLCFVPGRILFKLFGKDPMRRKPVSADSTYWLKHRGVTREHHYRRQH